MSWSRPVGALERVWLVAARRFPPFAIQLVLEGEGEPDLRAWRAASEAVGAANPGLRVVLRGAMCRAVWVDGGQAPPVREVDGSAWDGQGPAGADFLGDPLDPRGPVCEVLLVRGARPRVVLRALHAAVDGVGVLAWAEELGRALRGEPCLGHADRRTDLQLAGDAPGAPRPSSDEALPATGGRTAPGDGLTWGRVRVSGRPSDLLGRVAVTVGRIARAAADGPGVVRFDLPFDLRRDGGAVRSTANLTGMVPVDVGPQDRPADVTAAVRQARVSGRHAGAVRSVGLVRHLPLSWMVALSRAGEARQHRTGRFGATAVLSNLGRVDPLALGGGGFSCATAFVIPPGTPVTALFLTLLGGPDHVEIVGVCPARLAAEGRLAGLLAAIAAELGEGLSP